MEPLRGYNPVFAKLPIALVPTERGSIAGDFYWAATAPSLSTAAIRWREFISKHEPGDEEYEDGFHKRHVDVGRFELIRVLYLLGKEKEGDELLKKNNPLGL